MDLGLRGLKPKVIIKRADVIVVCVVLLLSICNFYIFENIVYSGRVTGVIVEVDGEKYGEYKINSKNFSKTVEIFSKKGYNRLDIENFSAEMVDASCPDKLDVHQGKITKPNQTIVCVPNNVIVRLVGESEVDGVAY